jgi:hypothetical protein
MLLHNQRGSRIAWEDGGFEWEPYGACEVPDGIVDLIKSTGFPVDVAPVAPREKARRAAEQQSESELEAELEKAKKALLASEDAASQAKAAAEAADIRATQVRAEADQAIERARVLDEEVRALRADATEFEKMLSDQSAEIGKLKEALALERAKADPAKPTKTEKR